MVRVVVDAPLAVQPLQHQLNGIDMPVREILVGAEEILQKRDMLTEPGAFRKGCGSILVVTSSISLAPACRRELAHSAAPPLPIEPASLGFDGGPHFLPAHIPQLRLQRIDAIFPAHKVNEAAAQFSAKLPHLIFRVQADHGLPGFQQIGDQQLQQEALALTGVAQDEDAGVGLVVRAAVKVNDDIAAEFVPADVEALGIGLAGVVAGVEIRHRGRRQDPLAL